MPPKRASSSRSCLKLENIFYGNSSRQRLRLDRKHFEFLEVKYQISNCRTTRATEAIKCGEQTTTIKE